jgi:hypothetical protein
MIVDREAYYFSRWPQFNRICVICHRRFNTRYESRTPKALTCSGECSLKWSQVSLKERPGARARAETLLAAWNDELACVTLHA